MTYAFRLLLSLFLVLPGVACSPQEADPSTPPASSESEGTLAMSAGSAGATSELGAEASEDEAPVPAEPAVDALGRHSVYSGVYSAEQAARGRAIQEEHCSACHAPDDWARGNVLQGYTGMSAYDLVNWLRESMPLDEPGRLSLQQYTDVAAFIFQLNGAPAGTEELPADPSKLAQVRLEYRRR